MLQDLERESESLLTDLQLWMHSNTQTAVECTTVDRDAHLSVLCDAPSENLMLIIFQRMQQQHAHLSASYAVHLTT